MTFDLPILITGVVLNSLLGLFVFTRNRKSATNILFGTLILDIVLWSGANYIALGTRDLLTALTWARIVMALAVPQAILFFLLVSTLPETRMKLRPAVIVLLSIAGIIAAVASLSPYLFPSIIFVRGSPSPTPGPAMPIFVLVAVGSVIAGVVTLIRRHARAQGILRRQLEVVGAGIVIMFALIVFFNFILVVMFDTSSYVSFSPLYTLPFVGATAYAIIRHRFLDVRAVATRAVSYALIISFFGILYALVFSLSSSLFVAPLVDPKTVGVSTAAALLMLLTFPAVKRLVETATDSVFYKDRYDTTDVLYRLTEVMASTLRLEDLTHGMLDILLRELRIEKGAIIIVREDAVVDVMSQGYHPFPTVVEEDIKVLTGSRNHINVDELGEGHTKSIMRKLDAAFAVQLRTEGQQIGLLLLSAKSSGDLFASRDIELLNVLAPEAAIAVQNAFAYEDIRRFNITLQEKVDRATIELRDANSRLRELDKLKDEFVSLASHELRTPLAAIRSYVWMALSGKGGTVSDRDRYYLDRAFSATNRLIKLVNDMLNISRIESGRMAVKLVKTDITKLVSHVIEDIRPKFTERNLQVYISSEEAVPEVIADPDKIEEVLINFVGNALKFTPPGGRIRINITTEKGSVRVSVTDTGVGISPDDLPKLFTKFGALRSGAMPEAIALQSTGLGLYISKSIIALHQGTVRASSPGQGRGSTFSFTLPAYSDEKLQSMKENVSKDGLGMIHTTIE